MAPRIILSALPLGSCMVGGAIHQFNPMKTSMTTAHSVSTVARLSVVICHQSELSMICSTIHHTMSPTPSIGAMNLEEGREGGGGEGGGEGGRER